MSKPVVSIQPIGIVIMKPIVIPVDLGSNPEERDLSSTHRRKKSLPIRCFPNKMTITSGFLVVPTIRK